MRDFVLSVLTCLDMRHYKHPWLCVSGKGVEKALNINGAPSVTRRGV